MKLKLILTLFAFLLLNYTSIAQNYRYTETLFTFSSITENVVYGSAPFVDGPYNIEENTTDYELKMDVFSPLGDTIFNRPAIIFAHGGGFTIGNKNHDDMMAFCDSLAKKGYVTATIDYRQGFNLVSNTNMHGVRAVYRGLQDGRTAVRFVRANAETFGVDPNKVYFVGSSAGAFIGLHSIYINEASEIPEEAGVLEYSNLFFPFTHTTPDLGPLDIGENINFNGEPDAVVSLWGAVQSTDLIAPENDKPVLLVHGEGDLVVPFEIGYPFSYPLLDNVFGSNEINLKLDSLGSINSETYFVPELGHEFYGVLNGNWSSEEDVNAYWDTIFNKTTNFLWRQHKPLANFTHSNFGLEVDFIDTSEGALSWLWDFGDGTTSTEQHPVHTFLSEGIHEIKLYIENDILSWDEITISIDIGLDLDINEVESLDFSYFPNPTNDVILFSFEKTHPTVSLKLYDLKGKLIRNSEYKNSSEVEFKFNEIPSGVYLMKVEKDSKLFSIKVVKN